MPAHRSITIAGAITLAWANALLAAASSIVPTDTISVSASTSAPRMLSGSVEVQDAKPGLVPFSQETTLTGDVKFDSRTIATLRLQGLVLADESRDDMLNLFRGRVLIYRQRKTLLRVADATIEIAPRSVVYIYATGESTVILNLHDDHRNAVVAAVGHEKIDVPPGRELLITRYTDLKFDEARLCPGIWYRTVFESKPLPNVKVFLTQFSTLSAVSLLPALRKLYHDDCKFKETICKTAVAVYTVSRDRQCFRHHTTEGLGPIGSTSSTK